MNARDGRRAKGCSLVKDEHRITPLKVHDIFAVPSDPAIVEAQAKYQRVYLLVGGLLAIAVIVAWLVPPLRALVPTAWPLMKINAAVAALLLVGSLALTEGSEIGSLRVASRVLALLGALLAVSAIYAQVAGSPTPIETLLVADAASELPGTMPVLVIVMIVAAGFSLMLDGFRWEGEVLFADAMALLLMAGFFTAFFGSLMRVLGIYPLSFASDISLETLLITGMLAMALIARRSRYGIFSVTVAGGLAGTVLRKSRVFLFVLPMVVLVAAEFGIVSGWLATALARSLVAAVLVVAPMVYMLFVAGRVSYLEEELGQRSLTDRHTGLLNRRGLYTLGEQELKLAQRRAKAVSVIFLDLEGLRAVNQEHGKEAGAAMVKRVADLLRSCFRETDLVGRVGPGDFVVVMEGTFSDTEIALGRLTGMVIDANGKSEALHPITFSTGAATCPPGDKSSFSDLLERASEAMLEKRREARLAAQGLR